MRLDRLASSGRHGSGTRSGEISAPLPDFRNLGIWYRVLLLVNGAALLVVVMEMRALGDIYERILSVSWRLEPILLLSLSLLALCAQWMQARSTLFGRVLVVGGVTIVSVLLEGIWQALLPSDGDSLVAMIKVAILSVLSSSLILHYLGLRYQAVRPALDIGQMAALTARIRPHFLFNSLNAVLSLIRKEPRRAEEALESLSELFRVLMRDPRDLVPLSEEILLCRQYLDLERLRLGDRLRIEWSIDDVPQDCLVPPLMLQPLIENAVYHGIEPSDFGGTLRIVFKRQATAIRIEIINSLPESSGAGRHLDGNQMAMANIRQRLALHYDLEASLDITQAGGEHRVTLLLPSRRRKA